MSTSEAESEKKMVTLTTGDKKESMVEEEVANMALTIKRMIDDGYVNGIIPLPNVDSEILKLVLKYCKAHFYKKDFEKNEALNDERDMENWDKEFMKGVNADQDTLFGLLLAANYLEVEGLLDLTCRNVAGQMSGKTPEQIRQHFHIKKDYTAEEEAELRRELSWAFD